MALHTAQLIWQRQGQIFIDNQYSRGHEWHFDGGAIVAGSSSPDVVPLPMSVAENVDPEEAVVAALSSCHLLFFLSLAAKKKWRVDEYRDTPVGTMGPNAKGKIGLTHITLRPQVVFSGVSPDANIPSKEEVKALHDRAHDFCYIANSLSAEIFIDPVFE